MALPSPLLCCALLVAFAGVHAVPVQGGLNLMRHDEYAPLPTDFVSKYLEDHGAMEQRNLDDIGGGHMLRQTRRGFDSASGAFGEPRRFHPLRKMSSGINNGYSGNIDEIDRSSFDQFAKRNIDEIDRTAFDSFFKRNFDEIDRSGFDSFVKRLADYSGGKHRI